MLDCGPPQALGHVIVVNVNDEACTVRAEPMRRQTRPTIANQPVTVLLGPDPHPTVHQLGVRGP